MTKRKIVRSGHADDRLITSVPWTDRVILRRDEDGVHTNVPHLVVLHSPTGYEWGYGGSGPADLALNILENYLRHTGYKGPSSKASFGRYFNLAWDLHQTFKWSVIALQPREGAEIPYAAIDEWVKAAIAQLEPRLLP